MKTIKSITEAERAELPKLPEGWQWTKIGDLCYLINGRAFKPAEWSSHGIPIVRIQNLNNEEAEFNYCDFWVEEKFYLNNGQLLFAWSGTPGTSFGAHIWNRGEAVLNQHIFKININESYTDKKFLMYVMNWNVTEYVKKAHGTAGLAHITKNKFETSYIPFPPLPEQRAIVSKIEQLFSELDNGITNLKLAQEQLKVYRQAVLKKAFEGELTKKWREQQTDLLDAGELLGQIKKEREKYAKVSGKKQKPVKMLPEEEVAEFPRVPDGWRWVKIGQVSKVGTGVTPLKKRRDYYESGTIPWVTSGALNESYVNSASDYVTELALKETNLKIYPKHTLLVALYGEGKTRGKCSELLIEATTNQAIAAIVQEGTEEEIRPYLKWFLMKNYNEIRMKSSGGVQPNLNLGIIENTSFPLCSFPEQQVIVQEIETRLSVCDKIEQDIETNLEKAEALRQSILKKAFEGKLLNERELAEVRGAEDWEPAEVLLERIKAERAGNGKK